MEWGAEVAGGDDDRDDDFPHWVAQPYVSPLPATKSEGASLSCAEYYSAWRQVLRSGLPPTAAKRPHSELTLDPGDDDEAKRLRHDDVGWKRAPTMVMGIA